jgi:DNA-binding transcriptional ArsR family regulator
MIHLHLTPESLSRTRFTYSPLIEVMTSYRLLRQPNPEKYGITPVQQRWVETTRRVLHDVRLPWLDTLATAASYIPDFLTPTPDHFETDIECDLFHLLHTPHPLVQKYLAEWENYCSLSDDKHLPEWGNFAADPAQFLPQLIDEIRVYWQRAIEPHWPALLSVIEGDILFRARQLALDGTDKLLNDISPTAKFDGKALRLDKSSHKRGDAYFVLDTEGLHLVPTVFADHLMWQVASDYKPMILYGARGTGAWQQSQPDLDESLELLLGAGRASVLAELVNMPATTTELAHHLHLTAGAVSQHLSLLQRAGLVNPQRSGKRVYYQLSPKGSDLLRLFR